MKKAIILVLCSIVSFAHAQDLPKKKNVKLLNKNITSVTVDHYPMVQSTGVKIPYKTLNQTGELDSLNIMKEGKVSSADSTRFIQERKKRIESIMKRNDNL